MAEANPTSPLQALSKRSFAQWMISYAVVVWFLLEFLDFLIATYGWEPRIIRVATTAGITGFTVMATIAWFHGEKGRQKVSPIGAALLVATLVLVLSSSWSAWDATIGLLPLLGFSFLGSLVVLGLSLAWLKTRPESPASLVDEPSSEEIRERVGQSIAVMRFEAIGDDLKSYVPDAIVEEVIGQLSTLPQLRVASRNSAYSLQGELADDPKKVGDLLGVAYVLYGAVQKYGDTTRVRASLVDTVTGLQEWSNRYESNDPNVFNLQDQIAEAVAESLALTVAPDAAAYVPVRRDTRAFQLFAKARYLHYTLQEDNLRKAIQLYKDALRINEDYPIAYAGLLESYMLLGFNYVKPSLILSDAISAAVRGSQLPNANSSIHRSLAFFNMVTGDFEAAERSTLKAIQMEPDNAENHGFYSNYLTYKLRFDEAEKEMALMLSLDRVSLFGLSVASYMNYFAGRFDQALVYADRVIELFPAFPLIHLWRGSAHEMLGHFDQAMDDYCAEQSVPMSARAHQIRVMASMGKEDEARRELENLLDSASELHVDPYRIALVYVALGDVDAAFAWMNNAADVNSFHLATIDAEPMLDPIRPDSRFEKLREKAGLIPDCIPASGGRESSTGLQPWLDKGSDVSS